MPSPMNIQQFVETLRCNGIVVIPNFLDQETIAEMKNNLPEIEKFEESVEGDKALFYLDAHKLPSFKKFFESTSIRNIVSSYISQDIVPFRQSIEWRRTPGQIIACDRMYHMDTWKYRVKAFLYLHDVGPDDAPMVYLQGSHKGSWRIPMEAKIEYCYKTDKRGYAASSELAFLGCFWPYEVESIKQAYRLKEVICTGSAGSLVIFDARGLHKATELRGPFRKLLISYWIQKGHHT